MTFVPNPAIDKTIVLPGFKTGQTFRVGEVLELAGGKGFNFARALTRLGQSTLVVGPVGGHRGRLLVQLAFKEGLNCDCLELPGELRTCLTIIDPQANYLHTELYEKGPTLSKDDWDRLVAKVASHFASTDRLVVCGSFPSGVPETGLAEVLKQARVAGLEVILDTYGPQFHQALSQGPNLVKINQHEAGEAVGFEVKSPQTAQTAARQLQKRGAQAVVITLGSWGAVGLAEDGQFVSCRAPQLASLSPIGSGDSFLAGLVAGLAGNQGFDKALKLAVAAGAANTLQIGAGRFELEQLERILQSD